AGSLTAGATPAGPASAAKSAAPSAEPRSDRRRGTGRPTGVPVARSRVGTRSGMRGGGHCVEAAEPPATGAWYVARPMIRSFVPTSRDLRALVRLAIPIVTAQVGVMLMGVVDTIVVGHVSARELAAASLGHLYVMGLAVFAFGTLWSIDPIV